MSLTSMAERTLGSAGARLAGATYLFLHYALLVACALTLVHLLRISLEVRSLIGCNVPLALPTATCLLPCQLLTYWKCLPCGTHEIHHCHQSQQEPLANSSATWQDRLLSQPVCADIAKAGSIVGDAMGAPHAAAAVAFAAAFSALCFYSSPRLLDRVNSALVVAVVASFLVRTPGWELTSRTEDRTAMLLDMEITGN